MYKELATFLNPYEEIELNKFFHQYQYRDGYFRHSNNYRWYKYKDYVFDLIEVLQVYLHDWTFQELDSFILKHYLDIQIIPKLIYDLQNEMDARPFEELLLKVYYRDRI